MGRRHFAAAANVGSQVLINMDGLNGRRGKWGAVADGTFDG